MRGLTVALGVAYPVLAHWAVESHSQTLTLASVAVLLLLPLLPGLATGRALAWLLAACAAALWWWLARHASGAALLYLPPVAINLFLAWLFGHTLLAGRMPLIERMVRLLHDDSEPLEDRVPPYARRLTLAWAVLFLTLAMINGALALLATPEGLLQLAGFEPSVTVPRLWWSRWANIFNYLLVGVFFVAEYAWRRRVFPRQPYRDFADFTRRVIAVGPRLWRDLRQSDARA